MNRRAFIRLLGGAAAAWPVAARAQQSAKLPTVGFLGPLAESAMQQWTAAFVERLRELGWIDSRTLTIEYRYADGHSDRAAEIATEFVRLKVAVIVTGGVTAVVAAKKATSVIPIVFATAGDPVGTGLVTSLSRPGGNVTGLSNQSADLAGKRLELFREIVPKLRRLAIMFNADATIGVLEKDQVQIAARALDLEVVPLEIRQTSEIVPAIRASKDDADGLYVVTDPLMNTNRAAINTAANEAHLPTMHGERAYVEAGGLISYGPDFSDLFRRCAELVDKILRGAKPADIPVEQPTKFDLAINLKTAKALDLHVPQAVIATANQVVE